MPSWRRNRRYIVILASVSALILLLGALFRPGKSKVENIAPVAQTDIARLQRLTVRNSVNEIASYFAELAARVENQVLRLPGAGRSGVVWASDRVVSSSGPGRPPAADVAAGRSAGDLTVELLRFGPQRPAALYQVLGSPSLSYNVRFAAGFYTVGVWALVTWRDAGGQQAYELGQYLGPGSANCDGFTGTQLRLNIDLSPEMLGGAVYDADGALMGLIVDCGGAMVALDAATVEASLAAPQRIEDQIAGLFGLAVSAPSEDERKSLDVGNGVLIRQVWRGYQADVAGLLPGDVIVRLDSNPVRGIGDLERMTLPVAREVFDLTVLRAGREREVRVNARPKSHSSFGPAGVAWKRPALGLAIEAVDSDSRLAQAGVRAGDRLLRIDGRPAERAEDIDKVLAQPEKRVFAVFERNGRLWGALL